MDDQHAGVGCPFFDQETSKCIKAAEETGYEAPTVKTEGCEQCLSYASFENQKFYSVCSRTCLRNKDTRRGLDYAKKARQLRDEESPEREETQDHLKKFGLDFDGFGTYLHSALARLGFQVTPKCRCMHRIRLMNKRGVEWCEANVTTIVAWLQEEAKRRGYGKVTGLVPTQFFVSRLLGRYARKQKKKQLKTDA